MNKKGLLICLSIFFLLFVLLAVWGILHLFSVASEIKSIKQKNLYYGVNVDMSQLVPGSRNYIVNSKGQDFIDIASHLGIHMFRITSVGKGFDTNADTLVYTKNQWDEVLNKMADDDIQAVILVEANTTNSQLNSNMLTNRYLQLVKQVVINPDLGAHKNVYAIDLTNEPILTSNNISKLQQAREIIKQKYPNMRITVGGWKVDLGYKNANGNEALRWNSPQDAHLLSNIVDFYAVHLYGFDQPVNDTYPDPYNFTLNFFEQNAKYLNNKPVLIEEFGSANGDAFTDQDTLGSQQLQANIYDGFYRALTQVKNVHIIGSLAYVLYPRGLPFSDGWDLLANNGNTIYPAAYVLQKYATGKSDIQLHLPYHNLPTDYMLHNNSNNQTILAKKNDIIAIQINLDTSKMYTIHLNNSTMLLNTEPLNYDTTQNAYEAVYHVEQIGKVTITINEKNNNDKEFSITVEAT